MVEIDPKPDYLQRALSGDPEVSMSIRYEGLNPGLRIRMLEELERDISRGELNLGERLTPEGEAAWPGLLREAISGHDDAWLANQLSNRGLLNRQEERRKPQGVSPWGRCPTLPPRPLQKASATLCVLF